MAGTRPTMTAVFPQPNEKGPRHREPSLFKPWGVRNYAALAVPTLASMTLAEPAPIGI
jgi:hypothetical protein